MNGKVDTYKLGQELVSGFSAKVVVGEAPDGKSYALKIYDLTNQAKAMKQL